MPHDGKVVDAVFSPDGTMILARSDTEVRLWCV